jgi:hypothetical protein
MCYEYRLLLCVVSIGCYFVFSLFMLIKCWYYKFFILLC